jgi:hypothetical protein
MDKRRKRALMNQPNTIGTAKIITAESIGIESKAP